MSLGPIKANNFLFLKTLKKGDRVGIDRKGRLYKRSGFFSWLTTFIRKSRLQSVVDDYVTTTLDQKKFHQIKSESEEYNQLMSKLSSLELFTDKKLADVTTKYYEQRYEENFFFSSGFTDQIYLIKRSLVDGKIFDGTFHPDSARYPVYGGKSFERTIDTFMLRNDLFRLTSKKYYYIHP